jgi:hypothetical protein
MLVGNVFAEDSHCGTNLHALKRVLVARSHFKGPFFQLLGRSFLFGTVAALSGVSKQDRGMSLPGKELPCN